jgi:sarcosine oxidase subunit gamma
MAGDATAVRRTPLDALAGGLLPVSCDGLTIEPVAARTIINLRGRIEGTGFLSAVNKALGIGLPVNPNCWDGDDDRMAIWLGPDEWLIVAPDGEAGSLEQEIRAACPEDPWLSVVDVSQSYTALLLSGSRIRELLAKGCPLDLYPRAFGSRSCAQSTLAKARVLLRAVGDGAAIEAWFRNSFTDYAVRWLIDASAEFMSGSHSERSAGTTTNPG